MRQVGQVLKKVALERADVQTANEANVGKLAGMEPWRFFIVRSLFMAPREPPTLPGVEVFAFSGLEN